ncbi:MAG: tetratricopeptide repeat protein [Gemmobacter sp.]|nr:tetratricopeptide repeat protein [Gemmobacter sp.]
MINDIQGNPLAGATSAAADLFDTALENFSLYYGDPVGALNGAIAAAPSFGMAHLAKGWLYALSTEPAATAAAGGFLRTGVACGGGDRESAHATALGHVLAGNWHAGGVVLERWQAQAPRDLMAMLAGHMIDFMSADARSLRDRVARVLPLWDGVPGQPWVMGMGAFGLEEAGDYVRAEAMGRAALAADPRDSWAHHAVAHVLEMTGRPEDGLGWMAAREAHWAGADNFLKIHNWWHRALCHLELDDIPGALALYDGPVRSGRVPVAMALLDASALLWRIDLAGADVGTRWDELSVAWEAHEAPGLYAFNDLHAAMAHLGAGRFDRSERLISVAAGQGEAAEWMRRFGLPLIEGFSAFRRGDHAVAVDRLMSARHIAGAFGGSHAQRDVIDWTLTEAAVRGGMSGMGQALARERLALRPHSPVNLGFLQRAAG